MAQVRAHFQRISRCDHPPQLIDAKTAQRNLGDQRMAGMRRIERTASRPTAIPFSTCGMCR